MERVDGKGAGNDVVFTKGLFQNATKKLYMTLD